MCFEVLKIKHFVICTITALSVTNAPSPGISRTGAFDTHSGLPQGSTSTSPTTAVTILLPRAPAVCKVEKE